MGRWLDRLAAEEKRENTLVTNRQNRQKPLSSVLSVPRGAISENFSADPDAIAERAALMEEGGIPRAWAEGLARLATMPPPDTWGRDWRGVQDGVLSFADTLAGKWLAKAHAFGWTQLDLFGCHPAAPSARLDVRGAATLIGAASVVAITAAEIIVEARPGRRLRITRPTTGDAVPIWTLDAKEYEA